MTGKIDDASRITIYRFAAKFVVACLLGSASEIGRTVGTEGWLALFALYPAIIAVLKKKRFFTRSFNRWDEALWLTVASASFYVLWNPAG